MQPLTLLTFRFAAPGPSCCWLSAAPAILLLLNPPCPVSSTAIIAIAAIAVRDEIVEATMLLPIPTRSTRYSAPFPIVAEAVDPMNITAS